MVDPILTDLEQFHLEGFGEGYIFIVKA